ncbi:MAG: sigma-70 family RNA polymerase sigma factor [Candidatus Riflebacteria bacterium]|nr:sigma-70 family RNA polymerase sigma factor [Candidatus Riflebacteria bacterium]
MVDNTEQKSGTFSSLAESTPVSEVQDIEGELLRRASQGHRSSFDRLVELHHTSVYRIAHRYFNNPEDALDATQEVFLRAWRAVGRFEGRSSFKTWIYRIASNTCITLTEERNRHRKTFFEGILDWFSKPAAPDPGHLVVQKEYQSELQKAVQDRIAKLPEVYRMPVILRDLEGMSLEQIGEILSLKEGTVKSRINRGRRLLQEALDPFFRDMPVQCESTPEISNRE